jgi:murein DD-endopeptidase MepM/ murein hydrolase activator NlpD
MRSRLLCLGALLLAASPLVPAGTPASAQTSTTTSTVPSDTTTTTTTSTSTTTTTTVVPPGRPTTTSPTAIAPPPAAASGDEPVDDSFVLPPELQARMNAVRRSRPNNNAELLAVVRAYAQKAGLPLDQAMVLGLGHVPVAGPAHWVHDWLMARRGPPVHLHQGIDIWAAMGTPIRAPFSGRVRYETGGLGGLAAYVTIADGTYYYLAHMAGTAPGLTSGAAVTQGQIVGFVGDSGNARGGPAHLHFEIHPRGGAAVDPKAILDRWVAEATTYAFALAANPTATTAPEPAPVLETGTDTPAIPVSGPRQALRTANTRPGGNSAGSIFVVGSLITLCGARVLRRTRANMTSVPDDEQ